MIDDASWPFPVAEYQARLGRVRDATVWHGLEFIFLWQARNFEGARKRVQGYAARPIETLSQVPFEVSVSD